MSPEALQTMTSAGTARSRTPAVPAAALAAVLLAGCAPNGLDLATLGEAAPPQETASLAAAPASAAPAAAAPSPSDAAAPPHSAIAEARRLRLAGDKLKALAVLDEAGQKEPKNIALTKERGLVALDVGKVKQAETLLRKAFDPRAPDWRLRSALGAALAAQGKQADAQLQFAKALEIVPDHPSVLNNLALSYALDGKHDEAERLLKRVAAGKGAEPRAQQNLALILGLKGKVGEAKRIGESVLPPDALHTNLSYLEGLRPGGERAKVSRAEHAAEAAVASSGGD